MLPIGETECKPCPVGHFSIGGGDVYDEWEIIPRGFYTYCESLSSGYVSNCGWEAKEDYIWSGEHEDDNNFNVTIETTAVVSSLLFTFFLVLLSNLFPVFTLITYSFLVPSRRFHLFRSESFS
jgi:hypothetical protein